MPKTGQIYTIQQNRKVAKSTPRNSHFFGLRGEMSNGGPGTPRLLGNMSTHI